MLAAFVRLFCMVLSTFVHVPALLLVCNCLVALGKALTDAEIVDQITTFLLAGHETTANTLAWAVHLLSRNPSIQVFQMMQLRCGLSCPPLLGFH